MPSGRRAKFIQRQTDAIATRDFNARFKVAERDRRDERIRTKLREGKLPYTPVVMSWLSRKLDKPSTKIRQSDVDLLLS